MFAFVPTKLQQPRALVVVLHGCGQTAAGYDLGAGWSTLAKHYGFALLMPEQQPSNNANGCFNWFNPEDTARERGEACSIRQMIAHMVADYGIDQRRIFVTGLSAGGAMTSAMLATYPEVFAGGAIIAGLPFGVASNVREALIGMRSSPSRPAESSAISCARPPITKVRGRNYRCGTAAPIAPSIPATPTRSSSNGSTCTICRMRRCPKAMVDGHPRQVWWNADGETIVESYTITDMAHGTPLGKAENDQRYGAQGAFLIEAGISSSYHIAKFFGLTDWIRKAKAAALESPSAKLIPAVSPISATPLPMPDLTKVLWPLAALKPPAEPEPQARSRVKPRPERRRGIDVSAVITRALTAAGLMK